MISEELLRWLPRIMSGVSEKSIKWFASTRDDGISLRSQSRIIARDMMTLFAWRVIVISDFQCFFGNKSHSTKFFNLWLLWLTPRTSQGYQLLLNYEVSISSSTSMFLDIDAEWEFHLKCKRMFDFKWTSPTIRDISQSVNNHRIIFASFPSIFANWLKRYSWAVCHFSSLSVCYFFFVFRY